MGADRQKIPPSTITGLRQPLFGFRGNRRSELVDLTAVAREQERRRICRELHDVVGPSMTAAAMRVEVARGQLADNPSLANILTDALTDIRTAVGDLRRLLYGLQPDDLGRAGGLLGSLHQEARRFEQACAGRVRVKVVGPPGAIALPPAVDLVARRVVAEALTNMAKHSGATHCLVELRLRDSSLDLEISDDGIGLSTTASPGLGLANMASRVRELNGVFRITGNVPSGTRIVVELPLRGDRG